MDLRHSGVAGVAGVAGVVTVAGEAGVVTVAAVLLAERLTTSSMTLGSDTGVIFVPCSMSFWKIQPAIYQEKVPKIVSIVLS